MADDTAPDEWDCYVPMRADLVERNRARNISIFAEAARRLGLGQQ